MGSQYNKRHRKGGLQVAMQPKEYAASNLTLACCLLKRSVDACLTQLAEA
jgi:hypothetical protein